MTLVFAVMHLYKKKILLSILFFYTFLKSGIDGSTEWSTIPACPSLVLFFNRGDTEGTGSTEVLCSMFVYALFYVHLCQHMPFSCTFCMKTMKKAKENWIGEQCSEIEENLRKNNSKRHTTW